MLWTVVVEELWDLMGRGLEGQARQDSYRDNLKYFTIIRVRDRPLITGGGQRGRGGGGTSQVSPLQKNAGRGAKKGVFI